MLTRTVLVPSAGYRPRSRWQAGAAASIRQVDWDLDGPIITVAPLGGTQVRAGEPEAEAAPAEAPSGPRRGLILDILV